MTDVHTESAFESAIVAHLTAHGYREGSPDTFDQSRSLFPDDLFAFIAETQPKLWESLVAQHGVGLKNALLDALVKTLDADGTLYVLRHGFKFFGKKIQTAFFKPAFGLNPEAMARYQANRLTVTRQVRYLRQDVDGVAEGRPDLVISLNGLPVVTLELKNQMTGQDVENARKQYMFERDPRCRDGGQALRLATYVRV